MAKLQQSLYKNKSNSDRIMRNTVTVREITLSGLSAHLPSMVGWRILVLGYRETVSKWPNSACKRLSISTKSL